MSGVVQRVDPTWLSLPDWHDTDGPHVADMCAIAGYPPDPEQRLALDAIFAVDKRGRSVAFETALICCRQNMKTATMKQAALGWLFSTERLTVWSAHEFRTAQEAFRDLDELITNCDVLRKRVRNIYRGNGDESIETLQGGRLIFKTRTKGGGRGLTGDKVLLDEAFALQPMHMGALLPTLSARPDPQVVYGSSAGLAESGVLRGVRDRGRAKRDPQLAYLEWCAPDPEVACERGEQCDHALTTPGCGCDKPDLWQMANPALGRRIGVDYIAAERRAMPPAEFGRERMGWWDDPGADSIVLDPIVWARLEQRLAMESVAAFGLEVSLDRSFASVVAAGPVKDAFTVELVERRRGTGWVVDRCVELASRHGRVPFVLDGGGPAADLIPRLEAAGLDVVAANARDVVAACAGFVDAVSDGSVFHCPHPELDAAVSGAKRRPLGDGGFAFGRKVSTVDITPLVAATLAHWRASSVPPRAPEVWSIAEMVAQLKAEQAGTGAGSAGSGPVVEAESRPGGVRFIPLT